MAVGVTVVLVAFHGDRWLPDCVRSLADASEHRLHLVLVDNSGNSELDALLLDCFDTEVIRTAKALGFAEANNDALVRASRLEPTVLFLNQDTISTQGWIDECLQVLGDEARLGAVSPLIRNYEDDGWDQSFLACLGSQLEAQLETSPSDGYVEVRNAPAPALLVRTDILRRTGPFDPIFGSYYEDFDLCRRIRRLGYHVGFARGARIRHYSGSTTTTKEHESRRMRQIIRNRFIYQLRESDGRRAIKISKQFLFDFPRRVARGVWGTRSSQPPAVTLRAHADLVRILPRLLTRSYDERLWSSYLETIGWSRLRTDRVADEPYAVGE